MTILDDARRVAENGPVCDSCLGRCFAERSFGLTNDERGRSLRVAVALEDDVPYETDAHEADDEIADEDEQCWVCEGESQRFDEWAEKVAEALEGWEFDTYQVGTRTPPLFEENEALLRESAGLPEDAGESFKSEFNREVGKRVGQLTGTEVDFERPHVLALLNVEAAPRADEDGPISDHAVEIQVNSAFVYGRYRKLERDIPQTEWPCRECGGSGKQLAEGGGEEPCDYCGGSGYLYEESVEELTTPPVLDAMDGGEALFHGAGREDVDAKMVGTGRPFVIEVKRPRERGVDTDALEERINEFAEGKVEVTDLALATHEMVERVKGLDASKTYRMAVEFDDDVTEDALQEAIAELRGTTVEQDTPQRVDHRRASLTRTRTVYDAESHLEDSRHAELEVNGEGGLYVKELVSGDEERTTPSLTGLLGVGAVVTALDVLAVEGEDEEFADPEYLNESV